MSVRLTIFWIGDDGIVIDTEPAEEIFAGYELVLDVIARLDDVTPTRYELRSSLGNFATDKRSEIVQACALNVIHFHRAYDFELIVHPSTERYTLTALSQDPTGFSFGVEMSRQVGDRMWAIVQELAAAYRERGIDMHTSIAGAI